MRHLPVELELVSDAALGTGLGSVTIDDHVPRDGNGSPCVPATHIRGLLRERLRDFGNRLGRTGHLDDEILGGEGPGLDSEGLVRISDFTLPPGDPDRLLFVSRTALDENGTARNESLRTTEAVAVGTVFKGSVRFRPGVSEFAEACVRLALLSIPAVGGSRTRGCGACILRIEGETRSPGAIFRRVAAMAGSEVRTAPPASRPLTPSQAVRLFRVEFIAESPLCCPEAPTVAEINVIRSGIAIPASAVQGAVLHRINDVRPELAGSCFQDPRFRAWPLHPCGGSPPWGVLRAPVTLRLGQDASSGEAVMLDGALHSGVTRGNVKFRSAGGVLLGGDGGWKLLPEAGIRRMVSAHFAAQAANGADVRELFTVDALAPTGFRGLLALPDQAAGFLDELIREDPSVHFGKRRGVQGGGRWRLLPCDPADVLEFGHGAEDADCLIIQSPVVIDVQAVRGAPPLEEMALGLFGEWAHRWDLPQPERFWGSVGVRFGWNRHRGKGRSVARCVLLPGSVIRFSAPMASDSLTDALLDGVGPGRDEGFGAVAVHPGLPSGLHKDVPRLATLGQEGSPRLVDPGVMREIRDLQRSGGPTASQIAAFRVQLIQGKEPARKFLEHQRDRGHRIWKAWKPFHDRFLGGVGKNGLLDRFDPEQLAAGLKTLIDLKLGEGGTA